MNHLYTNCIFKILGFNLMINDNYNFFSNLIRYFKEWEFIGQCRKTMWTFIVSSMRCSNWL